MGPQHPATHGVLRVDLELDGETIVACDPQVGYLHRGIEKLAENRTYAQTLILTDRLDYIAAMSNNCGFCVAVEKLLAITPPLRARYIRTIVNEMSRLASHLLWLATHALDIGAMTVFLYCFREREILLELFEELCGARLTFSYPRIGGVRQDVNAYFIDGLQRFIDIFPEKILEYETLIDTNRIWLKRTVGIGKVSREKALSLGLTGACLRASGVDYDVRKHQPYDAYDLVDFEVPIGQEGDSYARYRCRMEEMRQSVRILQQCIDQLPPGPIVGEDAPDLHMSQRIIPFREARVSAYGTGLIALSHKTKPTYPAGDIYVATEVPKGELGFYIISDGSPRAYRMHIRSPSFIHISALTALSEGGLVADLITNIGSVDVVLGESDR
ncbi:MAG: NADH-quinone oxidoreductase subunit D [Desulfobulbus sp.]